MSLTIRRATPADAPALRALAISTFRDAFAADNRPDDLEMYLATAYSAEQVDRDLADANVVTFLATAADGIAAFAQLRQGKSPPTGALHEPIELWRFYVDKAHHGQGIAVSLMDHVITNAIALGARTLWLGVWERNARGIAFYKKCGFTDIGSYVFVLGSDAQTDRIMSRPVSPADRVFYHGTRATLQPGALLEPGYASNYTTRRSPWIYFSQTLNAAAWGAELAKGDGRSRIYVVEPTGPFVDDPNLTDQRFPGNPTKSYRSGSPLRVLREHVDWTGHTPEEIAAMKQAIAGLEPIDD